MTPRKDAKRIEREYARKIKKAARPTGKQPPAPKPQPPMLGGVARTLGRIIR
jgi:hypothetical protein